ncbi:anaphase-promoting complex subunit 15-like isoform X1 [Microplitis mediator]|uniref:anaphase-promoting complex subunit 15 isoform X1 n=1 Tax=Microplitis demolitor TaxID=69319 RepID=UPI0004CCFA18|nr:anaphase-promoting complex subunit 15 isoform X1 [Microplitis demolitor]XP_057326986.1 anaphase-promoting complex subunit 15-like isoform X1 [Microplitis mediator]
MSFMPLWPNLQPRATDPLWFNVDKPIDDEEEVEKLETVNQAWKDRVKALYSDQIPIGKSASDFRGSEEEDDEEEEEEGEGEEEEESDTHEEEEEEFDEIDMEVSYTHQQQRSSPTDTPTDPVSIRMVTTSRYS